MSEKLKLGRTLAKYRSAYSGSESLAPSPADGESALTTIGPTANVPNERLHIYSYPYN